MKIKFRQIRGIRLVWMSKISHIQKNQNQRTRKRVKDTKFIILVIFTNLKKMAVKPV